ILQRFTDVGLIIHQQGCFQGLHRALRKGGQRHARAMPVDPAPDFAYDFCMKTSIAFAIMFSFACAAETAPAQQTLRHYEFRADQLPQPFATPSAGNPPRVTSPPAGAQLILPPGFKISVFADTLD